MRVAILVIEFPAVSETFILDQITGLIDRGHDVHIIARQRGDVSTSHPAVEAYGLLERTIHPRPAAGGPIGRGLAATATATRIAGRRPARALHTGARALHGIAATAGVEVLDLAAALRDTPPFDIVHCHFGPNGVLGLHLRRLGVLEGRIVTSFHGFDLTRLVRARGMSYYRRLLREGDLHLPVSDRFRRLIVDAGGPEDRTAVHHMGVVLDRFPFRERALTGDEPMRLATVARLVEKKGLEYAIRAVAAAVRAGRRVQYDVIGDGPLRVELERLVRELDAGSYVRLLGWQDGPGVETLLQRTHVLLAPSVTAADGDQEGIPVTIMEAMAAGMPVLSTTHSGIPEIVADGVSGRLVLERDVDALATQIGELADHPERWPAMGRAGRAIIERDFDVDALNDRLVERYETLLTS